MFSKFSVKKPFTVLVGVILVIVLGVVSFTKMTTDLLPNISLPYVIVMTTYPGASPETVEMAVTEPLEASMATVSNIESVNSVSAENYSIVILEFAQSADMNGVSLEIRENLDQIKSYWDDSIGSPIIMKLNPDMLPVMIAAAGVEGMDQAQVSAYVNDVIVPELESVEGVASVSATGLLEESVNVVIRQSMIDSVNEKVFAAIDQQMEDARQELLDGQATLDEQRETLEDGLREIADGRRELADGEEELQNGKDELTQKQEETTQTLADAKRDLLTAKSNLEATKMNLTTNLTTARSLYITVANITYLQDAYGTYTKAFSDLTISVSNGDAGGQTKAQEQIATLKTNFLNSSILKTMMAADSSGMLTTSVNAISAIDWATPGNERYVMPTLQAISYAISQEPMASQLANAKDALNAITGSMGLAAYEKLVNDTIATINTNLEQVNAAIVEAEKGQLTAAIEFANANAAITLSEFQMDSAKTQLEAGQEQLEAGQEQLEAGQEQIDDGFKQLEEAQESAYDAADMGKIITADLIKNILTAQNFSMPAGYVTEEGISYLVRVGDKPQSIEELKALPLMDLHMDGVPVITLGDVADVFQTDNSAQIYTNVNGSVGVILTLQKQTGYSTGEVSDLLDVRFQSLREQNPDLKMITLMDQGIYIDLVMDSILNNIILGGALAILILLAFLKDWRPTLVVAVSIPISVVTAVVCMYFSGVTLNVISLSGLALGIGMLVDNSIVVIENIYRLRGEGFSMREAAIEGAKEVAGAIGASTLTTVCVFLPIVFTEGITRQLFVDMGLTIAFSLLASLLIALTVVPAMASALLTKTKEKKEGKLYNAFVNGYAKLLGVSLHGKSLVFLLVLILLAGSILLAFSKGTAFMPDMDSTQLTVSLTMPEGSTLEETGEATDTVVERIMAIEDVEDVGAMASSSNLSLLGGGGGSGDVAATTIYVVTKEDKTLSNEEIGELIKESTTDIPAEISVNTETMDMSAMGGSGIAINVEGRDLDTLQLIAEQVAEIIEGVEGTDQVSDGLEETSEELRILVDRTKASSYGLTVAQVFQQIYAKLAEASASTNLETIEQSYPIYVEDGEDTTLTRDLVKQIMISGTNEDGQATDIALEDIAEFANARSLNSISRDNQTRYVSVTATIAPGYNVGIVSTQVQEELDSYSLPEGYQLVFAGENEMINDAMEQVVLMLLLAVIFIYLIMVAQFQSLLSPFIIMFTIPLAFTGGFAGLYFSNSPVSIVAMIGFVMLAGIIVNNGIVLIDYINQLRERGMEKREAIIQAGRTRLRPVLMTALTTILAMSTMVFSSDMGAEMAKPMAVVTIGGLLYGTLLTLIVVPCAYDMFHPNPRKKRHKK